eukprot:COSAG02_NODE_8060_length_2728_cov_1.795359_3_plen_151_part_00
MKLLVRLSRDTNRTMPRPICIQTAGTILHDRDLYWPLARYVRGEPPSRPAWHHIRGCSPRISGPQCFHMSTGTSYRDRSRPGSSEGKNPVAIACSLGTKGAFPTCRGLSACRAGAGSVGGVHALPSASGNITIPTLRRSEGNSYNAISHQ